MLMQARRKAETTGLFNPTPAQRAGLHWVQTPRLDFLIVVGATGACAVLAHWAVHTSPLDFVPEDARHALYQTVMSASVTIAGFTLTSVSVLINLLRTPVAAIDTLLRPADKRRIGIFFIDCFGPIALVIATAFVAFSLDSSKAPWAAQWVFALQTLFIGAIVFAVLRFARIVAILRLLLPVSS
jgi:hypothetical protein